MIFLNQILHIYSIKSFIQLINHIYLLVGVFKKKLFKKNYINLYSYEQVYSEYQYCDYESTNNTKKTALIKHTHNKESINKAFTETFIMKCGRIFGVFSK